MKKQLLTFTLVCTALTSNYLYAGPLTDAIERKSLIEAHEILKKKQLYYRSNT